MKVKSARVGVRRLPCKKLWLAPEKRQRGSGRKNEHQTGLTRLMARDLGRRTGDTHKCTSRLFKDLHS